MFMRMYVVSTLYNMYMTICTYTCILYVSLHLYIHTPITVM